MIVSAPQFANQLVADGSTGITTNQLDDEGSGEGSGEGSADGILDVPDEADLDDDRRAVKFAGRKESAG